MQSGNVTDQAARATGVAITKQPSRVLACIRWFAAEQRGNLNYHGLHITNHTDRKERPQIGSD